MAAKQSLTPKDLAIPPTILTQNDNVKLFLCNNADIDQFIHDEALIYQEKCLGITYVFKHKDRIIGFATLCMGHINKHKMPTNQRLPKRIPSYPALLIGQLAVCEDQQNNKIGTFICDYCLDKANKLSQILGCRFLLVDAVPEAVKFYSDYGFILAPKQEKEPQKLMFLDITKRQLNTT